MRTLQRIVGGTLAALLAAGAVAVTGTAAQADPTFPMYGPYPATTAIDGRGSMDPNDRTATDLYTTGEDVYVRCQDSGLSAGGSTIWDYTREGYWIPDAYIRTGTSGFVAKIPRCLAIGINGTPAGGGSNSGPYPVKFAVDGRGSANPADRIRVDAYPAGSSLYVRCQDYGVSVDGSTLWIYTTDGYWVPDAYVTTGTSGRISGVPLCSSIGISGGGATNPNGGTQFKIRTTLNGYYEKTLSGGSVWDKYSEGEYVTVMCQAYGEVNYGGSTIWDMTSDGLWLPDFYVITGSSGLVMRQCDSDGPSGGGNRYLAKTTLNGYYGKSLTANSVVDKYPGGSYVTITCQAYGEFNYGGSAVWDKTSDGLWVADYYISTGNDDIIMSRCDSDPKPSGGPGNPTVPSTPSPGSVASGNIRSAIVNAARSQLGTHEWGDNCNPYGYHGATKCGDPWCAMFASWTWQQAGIDVYFPYSGTFETWGRNHGLLRAKNDIHPGDVVMYGTSYYDSHHIGVVVDVLPDGRITTIEGNYGNKVTQVGPFDPYHPAPIHTYSNIYAVVAPVADPSTDVTWSTGTVSDQDDERDGIDGDEELCTDNAYSGIYYIACLEYTGSQVRSHLYAQPLSTFKAVRGKLTLLDSAGDLELRTCQASWFSNDRSCDGPSNHPTSGNVTVLQTDIEVDGGWKHKLRVASMNVDGDEQKNGTYCGPTATQAILKSLGKSPLGSQDYYADKLGTDSLGTNPWDVRDVLNAELAGKSGLVDYVYHDYAAEGASSDKWEFVKNKLARSVDLGQPAAIVVQAKDIPWWDNDDTFTMHYLVVQGYGATVNDSGVYTVDKFVVWDPSSDDHFLATSSEMYSMTNMDGIPGQGHMIVVAE
ncbi:CHAP domain-containing protein [Catellatospora tritici]|uniref:CHAP domain-containing protein n=1 Tax=Catellatospora tritici TaxID=2851566 RepID=UPI001C2D833C|nr:CHAP domain-containing protein [Catellatospora tritici]MBV1855279.1 CHAP domain-containing protein [Catellatospora tritici]